MSNLNKVSEPSLTVPSEDSLFARHKGGRPRRYPIDFIKIGQTFLLDWETLDLKKIPPRRRLMLAAIRQEIRRHNKDFRVRTAACGLYITRTV